MKINEIIRIMERKLQTLELDKKVAYAAGNLDAILLIEEEVKDTQTIIDKLKDI